MILLNLSNILVLSESIRIMFITLGVSILASILVVLSILEIIRNNMNNRDDIKSALVVQRISTGNIKLKFFILLVSLFILIELVMLFYSIWFIDIIGILLFLVIIIFFSKLVINAINAFSETI